MPTESTSGRIVVGIDESDASVDALRWAVSDAVRTGATYHSHDFGPA